GRRIGGRAPASPRANPRRSVRAAAAPRRQSRYPAPGHSPRPQCRPPPPPAAQPPPRPPAGPPPRPGPARAPPRPPPGPPPRQPQAWLAVSARFGREPAVINGGLLWRVYPDKPDAGGGFRVIKEDRSATPTFTLPPGGYVVHVTFGLASAVKRVQLRPEP